MWYGNNPNRVKLRLDRLDIDYLGFGRKCPVFYKLSLATFLLFSK